MTDFAEIIYEATARRDMAKVLLIEYRCPRGCLLLHVWSAPSGRLWYRPRHKLAPATAEAETVEAARAKRTEDGFRVWQSSGGNFDELLDFFDFNPTYGGLAMNCDHVRNVTILCDRLAADAATASPGKPTRRAVSASVDQ
jgi:hypothetical protein